MNEGLILTWLAGRLVVSNSYSWCAREPERLRCNLCYGKINPRDISGHGHQHLEAIGERYDALCSLLAMAQQDCEELPARTIAAAIYDVFGFPPGSDRAKEFWQQHGGTAP